MDKKIIDEYFLIFSKGEIYSKAILDTERLLIEKALEYSSGNQIIAAKILGMNRNTLRTKIKKLNIDIKVYK
ncbi:MAG: helix-turn-helix domain-containing protein [Candidatus Omnitrophota bacterium]